MVCSSGEVLLVNLDSANIEAKQIQGEIFSRHNHNYINNGRITYSPDGRLLLSWGIDHFLRCWNPETGETLYSIQLGDDPDDTGSQILFGPDGYLCTAGRNGTVQWWSAKDGTPAPLPVLDHPDHVHDLLLSEDGEHLITSCRDNSVRVWDWRTGSLVSAFDHGAEVFTAALTRDGNIVSGGTNKALQVWDPLTGKALSPELPTGEVWSITLVQKGDRDFVLAGVAEGGVFGYDLAKVREHEALSNSDCLELGEVISGRRLTSTGSPVQLATEKWLKQWNCLDDGQRNFLQKSYPVNKVAWHRWMSDHPKAKAVRDWHREELRQIEPGVAAALDVIEGRRVAVAAIDAGDAAAREGNWAEARRHFETVVARTEGSVNHLDIARLGTVLLKLGDADAFHRHCKTFMERLAHSQDPQYLVLPARLYFCVPSHADDSLREQALTMARHSTEFCAADSARYRWAALARGMAELRAGDLAQAVPWLEAAEEENDPRLPTHGISAHAYHVLAAVRLGRPEEAAEHLRQAEEHFEKLAAAAVSGAEWMGVVFAEIALEEARAAIAGGGSE